MDGGGGMVPDYEDDYGDEDEGTKYELTEDDHRLPRGVTIENEQPQLAQGSRLGEKIKAIPKIDDRSPSSTIIDLQRRLEQVHSPKSNPGSSIPMAHKEYEKHLRQLELECRNHIKVEQQMKLHIETLQEKLSGSRKEAEKLNKLIG